MSGRRFEEGFRDPKITSQTCARSAIGINALGESIDSLLADYPYLEREDILQPCDTRPGEPMSVRFNSKQREAARGHEPLVGALWPISC